MWKKTKTNEKKGPKCYLVFGIFLITLAAAGLVTLVRHS